MLQEWCMYELDERVLQEWYMYELVERVLQEWCMYELIEKVLQNGICRSWMRECYKNVYVRVD